MPYLGAVLTLTSEPRDRALTLDALATDPRITLGVVQGNRLPVALETQTRNEDRDLWLALCAQPGVLAAELAFADFSDLADHLSADSSILSKTCVSVSGEG